MNRPSLRAEAFSGLAGEYVSVLQNQTEADPVALLIGFLLFAGNIIGKKRYVSIGSTKHYANMFVLFVGPTAKGRKGTAVGELKGFFKGTFGMWSTDCLRSGLSSGEGVIHDLRDPEPDDEDGASKRPNFERPPVADRRRLFEEPEFGRLLAKNESKNSILSPVLRSAWDSESLSNITKSPEVASDPHISIAASVTREELMIVMPEKDRYNGFINRFGIVWVERPRLIAIPQQIPGDVLSPLRSELRRALDCGPHSALAGPAKEVGFDGASAENTWGTIYREIETDSRDLGEFFSRFSPYVRRIAMIYATLDKRLCVTSHDLLAAKAVVDYFRDSVEMIYGTHSADSRELKVLQFLAGTAEATTTDLHDLFQRHIRRSELHNVLLKLVDKGLVVAERRDGDGTKGKHVYSITDQGRTLLTGGT